MRVLLGILLSLLFSLGYAEEALQPLPPDQAFTFTTHLSQNDRLTLQWSIAPGYYLYRDQLKIKLAPASQVKLGEIILPEGTDKNDNIRGSYQIYSGVLKVSVPLASINKGILDLIIGYQGCSAKGFCYSPIDKSLQVDLSNVNAPKDLTKNIVVTSHDHFMSEQDYAQKIFDGQSILMIVLSFLGLGLLLAFTPCVLPMIPILSGIIIGHRKKKLTTMKTFFLSLAYVLGMAITYAIAGIVIALIGGRIQAELQRPWVIILFSGIFVLLALSLFGLYKLQLPARWQQRLTDWSNRQKGGTYIGVFLMGSISSLIVSPCVSPPLVGVLAYIAQTGDVWLGATALLALGIGMGVPLLLIGASAGKLLPKAGPWMETLERLMGVMMLAFAIWLLSRVIPGPVALFLWSILLICFAIFMGVFSQVVNDMQRLRRGLGLVILIYGIILMMGAALGNADPFRPWENWKMVSSTKDTSQLVFVTLKNREQLDQELLLAKQNGKPVMIDFYADWCESCIRMERNVLGRSDIKQVLSRFVLLRADVTANNDFDQALLQRFRVVAPPTFLFFDRNGNEVTKEQIVGEMDAENFLSHLTRTIEKEPERAN